MKNHILTSDRQEVKEILSKICLPNSRSHKGQNGRLLVIGGSGLFHSSLIWAAEIASKMVDMVHVSSPAEINNRLIRSKLKGLFLNGIVVPFDKVEEYILEDDCILIGPGMPREEGREAGEEATSVIVNRLIGKYPEKKWVIDGGALQEVDTSLLNGNMIITPHKREWERLLKKVPGDWSLVPRDQALITKYSNDHGGLTILLKGPTDVVVRGDERTYIEGGNAGMTKGGTGDILAGIAAALACSNPLYISAIAASVINKSAGDDIYQTQGIFYNASDLLDQIPKTIKGLLW